MTQQDLARVGAVKKTESDDNDKNIVTSETRPNYNQDAPLYTSPGIDAPPLPDDRVLLVKTEGTGKFAIVGYLGSTQGAEPGELFLYSRDGDGKIQAILKLKKDGSIEGVAPEAISISTEKSYSLDAKENIDVTASKKATVKGTDVEINGNVVATGGKFTCKGSVAPTGTGALCGMKFCPVTGAPIAGSEATGT